eukprot:13000668-Heterocapsa_arctica.AAC.1
MEQSRRSHLLPRTTRSSNNAGSRALGRPLARIARVVVKVLKVDQAGVEDVQAVVLVHRFATKSR